MKYILASASPRRRELLQKKQVLILMFSPLPLKKKLQKQFLLKL